MRIGLFIPCYIDAFSRKSALRPWECWNASAMRSSTPRDQTCCGQPMANSGFNAEAADTEALFVRNFSGFDYVVAPSSRCLHHVATISEADAVPRVADRGIAPTPERLV